VKGCLDICDALGQLKNIDRGRDGGSFGWFSDFFFRPLVYSHLFSFGVCVCVCVSERERESFFL
jgi:hypothetical protein